MNASPPLHEITIRTRLRPGDIGFITYLHGKFYAEEYNYGIQFEAYVAQGLAEFYQGYDPANNRVWVCEHNGIMIGFLALVNRGASAQLRYFFIDPAYRGVGLGKKLMSLYMDFLRDCGYTKSYLLTTDELHSAAALYKRYGFQLTERSKSVAFGKEVVENRYEWNAK
jgi:GNAT superfamily N-acetyltransferase